MNLTHYIPYFTTENGRKRSTVCGLFIDCRDHTAEPTCPDCQAWLQQEATASSDADEVFGPPPPPSTTPKRYDFFDPCAGYSPKGAPK